MQMCRDFAANIPVGSFFFKFVASFDDVSVGIYQEMRAVVPCQKLLSRKQNQGEPPVQPDIMCALRSLHSFTSKLMYSRPDHIGVLQIRHRKLE